MPLTITQQVSIINGDTAPPDTSLFDLVAQSALSSLVTFRDNLKDTSGDIDATNYLVKINRVIELFYTKSAQQVRKLISILVVLFQGDFATVDGATQGAWETFVNNNIFASIEELALVTDAEKTAYNNIV